MPRKALTISAFMAVFPVCFATPATALELTPYVFGNAGIAEPDLGELEEKYQAMVERVGDNGGTATLDQDDRDNAWSAGIGIQLSRYFALEASYYHLGSYDIEASGSFTRGRGNISVAGRAEVDISGWGIQGVLIVPFTDRLSGTISAGPAHLETEVKGHYSYAYDSARLSDSEHEPFAKSFSDTVASLGAGARYAFNDAIALRVDYTYLGGIGDAYPAKERIDFLSGGLVYSF